MLPLQWVKPLLRLGKPFFIKCSSSEKELFILPRMLRVYFYYRQKPTVCRKCLELSVNKMGRVGMDLI